jgi:diguanylate cyclase (GGDEF)-like protein
MKRTEGFLDVLIAVVGMSLAVAQSALVLLADGSAGTLAWRLVAVLCSLLPVGMLRAAIRSGQGSATDGRLAGSTDGRKGPAREPGRVAAAVRAAVGLAIPPPPDRPPMSLHLLGLAPFCLIAPLLWSVAYATQMPMAATWVFVVCGVSVGVLLLVRVFVALLGAEWMIEHDLPTQVLSLAGMTRALRARTRRPGEGPLSFCMVALDDFKGVNDSLGGARANAVLALVARRLTTRLGERATVSRLGGDRFLALVPDHAGAGREVLDVFADPFRVDDRTVHLTASIGTAPVTADSNVEHLLGMVDVAVQAAKAQGKATVVRYRRELHEQVHASRRMERELRDLLDGAPPDRVGRVAVVFQPFVELSSQRIVGCEALARWHHPERRALLPDAFLPAAEQGGLTARLDGAVLDRALGALARWDADGLEPITMSVNLGVGSLTDPDLFARVRTTVQHHGLAFDRVRLEITEHNELPTDDLVSGCLRSLSDLGVRLSLDDFGTGYTSLDYLCRYPVDLVKIDRAIVLAEGARERSPLLEGIVGLASGLHVDLLAEGVENEEQRQRLMKVGVGQGQGYLFARPLRAAAFAGVMRRSAGSRWA